MRTLGVYFNDTMAGTLTEQCPGTGYSFRYCENYANSAMPPVSTTLPKRTAEYYSEYLFPFFANMVPEGANRRAICRSLKIDETDLFGLLDAMAGKDFIGAINIRRITDDQD